jgi:hypothetical protein
MRYAQIDNANFCFAVSDLSGPVDAAHMIPIAADENPLGKVWADGAWESAPVVTTPKPLTFVEFFALAYGAGLSAAKYAEARALPDLAIFFDMLHAAQGIQKDDPFTVMGAEAFVSAGIITQAQHDAIFDNWPEI